MVVMGVGRLEAIENPSIKGGLQRFIYHVISSPSLQ